MSTNENRQDLYLNTVRKNRTPVTVFLVNGYQLHGIVSAFDSFVVFLDTDTRQQIINKHAISTITSAQSVKVE